MSGDMGKELDLERQLDQQRVNSDLAVKDLKRRMSLMVVTNGNLSDQAQDINRIAELSTVKDKQIQELKEQLFQSRQ